MPVPTVTDMLKFANLQMAAEEQPKGSETHGTTLRRWNVEGHKKKKAESPAC